MAYNDCMPSLSMVIVQLGYAGMNIVSKLAMDGGMSPFVMIAYRQMIATIVIAPFAFFLERKTARLTRKIVFQIFLLSLTGATGNQLLYFMGLQHSTPTIACALSNTLPALTFLMAIPFRMETVGMKTLAGQAKVMGTALCVAGSMLMTFYQGPSLKIWPSPIHWKYVEGMTASEATDGSQNMLLGAALVILSAVSWAVWFIIQAKMGSTFSSPYTSSTIMCFFASFQCAAIGAGVERNLSSWALGWNIRLLAAVYTGAIGSGLAVSLMSWCINKRGPLFVSMFSPLMLVIVAVLGWAILDEKLSVGSVTGSLVIVGGLYMVLWGKEREMEKALDGAGGKDIDEEIGIDGSNGTISLPVRSTPSHESKC